VPAPRTASAALAVALVAALAACGSKPPPTATFDNAPAAATNPETVAATKSALNAYAGYLAAARKAETIPDPNYPELRKYLGDPLLTRVRTTIRDIKEHGAMRTGKLISDPRVTAVSLDSVPATVSIQDCIDATGYAMVDAKTKKKVPGHAAGRYVATATASRYPDGRWLINAGLAHRDQPC
jgi:predicted small lipoprotein YifL